MKTWPRRISIVLLIVIPMFGVASVSGAAEVVDSDSAEVGLVVTGGCPDAVETEAEASDATRMTSVSEADMSNAPAGTGSSDGDCSPAEPDPDGNVPPPVIPEQRDVDPPPSAECADVAASASSTSGVILVSGLSVNAQLYFVASMQDDCPDEDSSVPPLLAVKPPTASTAPVVSQLPETGVIGSQSAMSFTMLSMLLGGSVLALGALVGHRRFGR